MQSKTQYQLNQHNMMIKQLGAKKAFFKGTTTVT